MENLKKYIEQYIYDLSSTSYIITHETSKTAHPETKGQHFHFWIDGSFNYDSFRKSVLVNHYGLQGQAKNGIGRQYGKIKLVRQPIDYIRYISKDQALDAEVKSYCLWGYTEEDLLRWIEESYKKENHLSVFDKVMKHLETIPRTNNNEEYYCYYGALEEAVIDYYIDNNVGKALTKNHMRSLVTSFLMYYSKYQKDKRFIIYRYIRN